MQRERDPLEYLDLGTLRLLSLAVWRTLLEAPLLDPERVAMRALALRVSDVRMRVDPSEETP